MKRQYLLICIWAVFMFMVSVVGPQAYADNASQFNQMVAEIHYHRAQMEAELGLDPQADRYPHATCYYDDLVDHYEQEQIMSDFIDKGIR